MYEGLKIVFQEYGDFFGKFCAPFFIHLLDKLHKNVGQNIPWIFLIPWQGISSFSSFLTRNFKPRKMRCVLINLANKFCKTQHSVCHISIIYQGEPKWLDQCDSISEELHILMLQIIMEILQFIRQHVIGILKLSKSWLLWQTVGFH